MVSPVGMALGHAPLFAALSPPNICPRQIPAHRVNHWALADPGRRRPSSHLYPGPRGRRLRPACNGQLGRDQTKEQADWEGGGTAITLKHAFERHAGTELPAERMAGPVFRQPRPRADGQVCPRRQADGHFSIPPPHGPHGACDPGRLPCCGDVHADRRWRRQAAFPGQRSRAARQRPRPAARRLPGFIDSCPEEVPPQ
jgi:hypothetical protein